MINNIEQLVGGQACQQFGDDNKYLNWDRNPIYYTQSLLLSNYNKSIYVNQDTTDKESTSRIWTTEPEFYEIAF